MHGPTAQTRAGDARRQFMSARRASWGRGNVSGAQPNSAGVAQELALRVPFRVKDVSQASYRERRHRRRFDIATRMWGAHSLRNWVNSCEFSADALARLSLQRSDARACGRSGNQRSESPGGPKRKCAKSAYPGAVGSVAMQYRPARAPIQSPGCARKGVDTGRKAPPLAGA